jgi:polyferredoxin
VPSHALPPGPETRIRRRARRQGALRRLRDWRTWGLFLALPVAAQLGGGIVGHLWPKAHGVGYVIRVVVGGVLGGVIGAVLFAAVLILARAVLGGRRLQP